MLTTSRDPLDSLRRSRRRESLAQLAGGLTFFGLLAGMLAYQLPTVEGAAVVGYLAIAVAAGYAVQHWIAGD